MRVAVGRAIYRFAFLDLLIRGCCAGLPGPGFDTRCDVTASASQVKLGLLPGWGGTQLLHPLVGLQAALDMILTGEPSASRRSAPATHCTLCKLAVKLHDPKTHLFLLQSTENQ